MASRRPGRVLVIGYGSELRGEDRAGRIVAERIALWRNPRVHAVSIHEPGPELSLDVAGSDLVIFVDTVDSRLPVEDFQPPLSRRARAIRERQGSARARTRRSHGLNARLIRLYPAESRNVLGHTVAPSALLMLARALYGRCPPGCLIAIPASRFDFGDDLSDETSRAVDQAVVMIKRLSRHMPGRALRLYANRDAEQTRRRMPRIDTHA